MRWRPEHPFPIPLNDCIAAIRWVASHGAEWGIDPTRIAVAGDSAGANLALAATIALRDAGNSPVRGAACLYGCYAPDLNTASEQAYGGGPYLISGPEMAWYWNHYLSKQRGSDQSAGRAALRRPARTSAAVHHSLRIRSAAQRFRDAGREAEGGRRHL